MSILSDFRDVVEKHPPIVVMSPGMYAELVDSLRRKEAPDGPLFDPCVDPRYHGKMHGALVKVLTRAETMQPYTEPDIRNPTGNEWLYRAQQVIVASLVNNYHAEVPVGWEHAAVMQAGGVPVVETDRLTDRIELVGYRWVGDEYRRHALALPFAHVEGE